MNMNRLRKWLMLLVAMAVALGLFALVEANPAQAAFPGTNGRIAFTGGLDSTDPDNTDADEEIYTMMPDGRDIKQLTRNDTYDYVPKWSPSGQQIVFTSERDVFNGEIYKMDAEGNNPTRLTNNLAEDSYPAWSPDGTRVVFQSKRDGDSEIYVMDADGANQTNITNNSAGGDVFPEWSPDGTKIVFQSERDGDSEIYVMNADGSNQTNITNDAGYDFSPTWSPDGQQIAFSSNRESSNSYDIYVMNADGSNQTSLTNAPSLDMDPAWSPDGQQIMFVSAGQIGESNVPNGELYVMNADGSNQTRLTNTFRLEDNPDWQAHNVASRPPVASNDSYTTNQGQPLNETAPGVLANDTDPEGDTLTAVKVSDPANGTLTLNSDGSFDYAPNANFSGGDSFTYKANDGSLNSNEATVSITVNAVNAAPVAVDDSYSTNEDTSLTIDAPGVLANDNDAEGDALTVTGNTSPAHGTVTLGANGSFTYTPSPNYNGGPDTFTYTVSDGKGATDSGTVSVTVTAVNDAPVAAGDSYTTNQDTALNVAVPGVLANDNDPDGESFTAELVSGPAHGTLMVNANGSFTYTPNANYNGADSFTYQANDGNAASNIATVAITVNPVATSAPRVTSVSPPDQATGVSRSTKVTATFNVAMKPSSLANPRTQKSTTFILMAPGKRAPTQVAATVTCNTPCTTATLTPSKNLAANTTYTARVTTGVEDTSGKKLESDYTWSFRTGG